MLWSRVRRAPSLHAGRHAHRHANESRRLLASLSKSIFNHSLFNKTNMRLILIGAIFIFFFFKDLETESEGPKQDQRRTGHQSHVQRRQPLGHRAVFHALFVGRTNADGALLLPHVARLGRVGVDRRRRPPPHHSTPGYCVTTNYLFIKKKNSNQLFFN
jgi:hypothetical protein